MKEKDFYKANEELENEIQNNNKQYYINDERKRMSNVNQFEYKAGVTIGFSLFPYLVFMILSGILAKTGGMAAITEFIPAECYPLITICASLGIGNISRKLLERKYKTKERFESFSKAKTESEKVQEEVKYTIELEKAKNRNKVIKKAMSSLSADQLILDSLSNRYDINDKTLPQTEEEAKRRVEALSSLLKEKYAELDLLTTHKVLHEKFWNVRTKWQKVMDIIMGGMLSGAFFMLYVEMPLLLIRDYISSIQPTHLFIPLVIGAIGAGGYISKRNKNYRKAFINLNKELGENALPENIDDAFEENKDLNTNIENKIKEISIIENQLQESKRAMESFSNDNNDNDVTMAPSVTKEDDLQMNIISEHNQDNTFTRIDEDIVTSQETGPSLSLRKR